MVDSLLSTTSQPARDSQSPLVIQTSIPDSSAANQACQILPKVFSVVTQAVKKNNLQKKKKAVTIMLFKADCVSGENIENILEDVLNVTKTVAIDLKTVEDDDNFARISKNIRSSDKDLNLVLFHAKPTIVTKRIPYKIRTSFPNVHLVLYGNTNEFKSVCEIGGSQMSAKSSETAVYAMLADQASDIMIEPHNAVGVAAQLEKLLATYPSFVARVAKDLVSGFKKRRAAVNIQTSSITELQTDFQERLADGHIVTHSFDSEEVPYHNQGNSTMYSDDNLKLRKKLSCNSDILAAIELFWTVQDLTKDSRGCIHKLDYIVMNIKIQKVLAPSRGIKDVVGNAAEDWSRDSSSEYRMRHEDFVAGMFEMTDLWCATVEVDEYINFLMSLFESITHRQSATRGGGAQWKLDQDIDPDQFLNSMESFHCGEKEVLPVPKPEEAKRWLPGALVYAQGDDGQWWPGTVQEMNTDGTYPVRLINCDPPQLWESVPPVQIRNRSPTAQRGDPPPAIGSPTPPQKVAELMGSIDKMTENQKVPQRRTSRKWLQADPNAASDLIMQARSESTDPINAAAGRAIRQYRAKTRVPGARAIPGFSATDPASVAASVASKISNASASLRGKPKRKPKKAKKGKKGKKGGRKGRKMVKRSNSNRQITPPTRKKPLPDALAADTGIDYYDYDIDSGRAPLKAPAISVRDTEGTSTTSSGHHGASDDPQSISGAASAAEEGGGGGSVDGKKHKPRGAFEEHSEETESEPELLSEEILFESEEEKETPKAQTRKTQTRKKQTRKAQTRKAQTPKARPAEVGRRRRRTRRASNPPRNTPRPTPRNTGAASSTPPKEDFPMTDGEEDSEPTAAATSFVDRVSKRVRKPPEKVRKPPSDRPGPLLATPTKSDSNAGGTHSESTAGRVGTASRNRKKKKKLPLLDKSPGDQVPSDSAQEPGNQGTRLPSSSPALASTKSSPAALPSEYKGPLGAPKLSTSRKRQHLENVSTKAERRITKTQNKSHTAEVLVSEKTSGDVSGGSTTGRVSRSKLKRHSDVIVHQTSSSVFQPGAHKDQRKRRVANKSNGPNVVVAGDSSKRPGTTSDARSRRRVLNKRSGTVVVKQQSKRQTTSRQRQAPNRATTKPTIRRPVVMSSGTQKKSSKHTTQRTRVRRHAPTVSRRSRVVLQRKTSSGRDSSKDSNSGSHASAPRVRNAGDSNGRHKLANKVISESKSARVRHLWQVVKRAVSKSKSFAAVAHDLRVAQKDIRGAGKRRIRPRKAMVVAGSLNAMWALADKGAAQSIARLGSLGVNSGKQQPSRYVSAQPKLNVSSNSATVFHHVNRLQSSSAHHFGHQVGGTPRQPKGNTSYAQLADLLNLSTQSFKAPKVSRALQPASQPRIVNRLPGLSGGQNLDAPSQRPTLDLGDKSFARSDSESSPELEVETEAFQPRTIVPRGKWGTQAKRPGTVPTERVINISARDLHPTSPIVLYPEHQKQQQFFTSTSPIATDATEHKEVKDAASLSSSWWESSVGESSLDLLGSSFKGGTGTLDLGSSTKGGDGMLDLLGTSMNTEGGDGMLDLLGTSTKSGDGMLDLLGTSAGTLDLGTSTKSGDGMLDLLGTSAGTLDLGTSSEGGDGMFDLLGTTGKIDEMDEESDSNSK